jgi:hypothetical protein
MVCLTVCAVWLSHVCKFSSLYLCPVAIVLYWLAHMEDYAAVGEKFDVSMQFVGLLAQVRPDNCSSCSSSMCHLHVSCVLLVVCALLLACLLACSASQTGVRVQHVCQAAATAMCRLRGCDCG